MKRIEFIGAPYVGKSTLYYALEKQMKASNLFYTNSQILDIQRKRIGLITFLFEKVIQYILKQRGIAYIPYKLLLSDTEIDKRVRKYQSTLLLCFHNKIIQEKGISFSNASYRKILERINSYENFSKIVPEKIFLSEEGIVHWHLPLKILIENQLDVFNHSTIDEGLFPKGIILCFADEETLAYRIGLRKQKKKINRNHLALNDDEILKEALNTQRYFKKYSQIYENLGGKVCKINTAVPIEKNINQVINFLETFK